MASSGELTDRTEARAHRGAIGATLAAALLFGLGTPAAKGLLAGLDAALLAGLLYLGMGGVLALVYVAGGAPGSTCTVNWQTLGGA